jgi:hypothetical protein
LKRGKKLEEAGITNDAKVYALIEDIEPKPYPKTDTKKSM